MQRRALAHQHHAFEPMETFGQSFDLGDVLGKGFDLDFGLEALPIGEAQGNALIIVENGYSHYGNISHRMILRTL
jgi:hypothetical protein